MDSPLDRPALELTTQVVGFLPSQGAVKTVSGGEAKGKRSVTGSQVQSANGFSHGLAASRQEVRFLYG